MIALLIFIIYNSIIAFAIIPPTPLKPLNIVSRHFNVPNVSNEKFAERNVYMHVFVNSYEKLNVKDNLPYIETFSKKYTKFTFNFIVLVNDTSKHIIEDYSDELKNELALDSLWDETQHSDKQIHNKPTVQVISLSKYMDESPLKKYWRDLPRQFIGFLSRCIAIWNKGGIALNPIILTPKSPNPIYIEKLEQILGGKVNMKTSHSSKKILKKPRKKVNNIQDIINNLENEDSIGHNDADIVEAENIQKTYVERKSYKSKRNTKLNNVKKNYTILNDVNPVNKFKDLEQLKENGSQRISTHKSYYENLYSSTSLAEGKDYGDVDKQNLLPMFMKFLFRRNSNENLNNSLEGKENILQNKHSNQKELITTPGSQYVKNKFNYSTNITERLFPLNLVKENDFQGNFKSNVAVLTIDLNGNLISSATPCHAFIGTVFSNVFHHTQEESVKDLIINELSLFCKGTLSSCTGIDVMLL